MSADAQHPILLSSSGTSQVNKMGGIGTTGRKRKTSAGHQLMANITAETGEKMVKTLRDMTEANREMESKRLDFERLTHGETMAYRRQRDIKESEHKKQSLLNQAGFVSTIEGLATALTLSASTTATHGKPTEAIREVPPNEAPKQAAGNPVGETDS